MNVFNKMAALALLSTASYTAMAAEVEQRRAPAAPQPTVAEADVGRSQDVTPAGWDQVLDPHAYGQVSVRYQARTVDPALLRGVSFG
ncbi:hypothetical protein [uncultured Pseudomonas sp.]|uniref:hypothetical protein n=1 Tax=uncultured Pseudomonas sp. TaxID=114707 RepID=UPI0025D8D463|nr:hypothetical protein [uncultured Pseudomonas sp.]